jgi:putative ABC transport system ATP-binding protein
MEPLTAAPEEADTVPAPTVPAAPVPRAARRRRGGERRPRGTPGRTARALVEEVLQEDLPAAPVTPSRPAARPGAEPVPALVRATDLFKIYREGDVETVALRGASLELPRGQVTSLVGPSGSGKSTLLALLAGLALPSAGTILLGDEDITRLDEAGRARLRARRIGIVRQSGNLVPFLSALENVELAMQLAGSGDRRRRARELLAELGLGGRLHHRPRQLSGGEAQRVAVAAALANQPDLLLADEVTGELDSGTAAQVVEVILDAWRQRGLTVLLVTHDPQLAAGAQRRLTLTDGVVRDA